MHSHWTKVTILTELGPIRHLILITMTSTFGLYCTTTSGLTLHGQPPLDSMSTLELEINFICRRPDGRVLTLIDPDSGGYMYLVPEQLYPHVPVNIIPGHP